MLMDVADKKGGLPNLKGAAIGDGCYGNSIGLCGNRYYEQRVDAEIFAGHVMYPLTLYSKITAACPTNFSDTPSLQCKVLYSEMEKSLGDFNTYNIYDQVCLYCTFARADHQYCRMPGILLTISTVLFCSFGTTIMSLLRCMTVSVE